ncbi:secondary thiamine-phosphate synthase enzyme [Acuticoccus sediminis]|uniref:Secondary thiamine-phosphate synthase enzyme n=1 Tax=Acuticoccus sediminis TaxID=2184697 RepID=A0A8B2NRV5_9HYPH|nr:secondary thiamine-phosphate synthase enzyme YjbQ [Acuticoccus sediminis]RAI01040.1 secondary thiamine-phosphate synthase enzyme [Acuticoccus sediminis]
MIHVETLGEAAVGRVVHGRIDVATRGPGFTDVTAALRSFLRDNALGDGLLNAFVSHTTASLTVQENADPDVQTDLLDALDRLAPRNRPYVHSLEGTDDMPGHIKAMLSDTAVTIAVAAGRLRLGTWQALYLIEHRDGGRHRSIDLTYVGR